MNAEDQFKQDMHKFGFNEYEGDLIENICVKRYFGNNFSLFMSHVTRSHQFDIMTHKLAQEILNGTCQCNLTQFFEKWFKYGNHQKVIQSFNSNDVCFELVKKILAVTSEQAKRDDEVIETLHHDRNKLFNFIETTFNVKPKHGRWKYDPELIIDWLTEIKSKLLSAQASMHNPYIISDA